ncbi:MAG TPA: DNA recombination protein RmuC [Terriglobia bacterium]|nr:DNA recombination protein RmuC [Terriglobia bacterium]
MNSLIALGIAAGLVLGAVSTWMIASGRLRQAEGRAVGAGAEADALRRQHDAAQQEIAGLRQRLEVEQRARAVAETSLEAGQKSLEQEQQLVKEAQLRLTETFKALSGDVLASQSHSFLQLAQQSFSTLRAEAEGELATRQQAIESLVGPLGDSLKTYGEMLRQMEKARAEAYGSLTSEIKGLLAANESLQRETGNLTAALKGGPQVRGRWGEMTLRRVVELAGMSEHCDFAEQETLTSEGERLRPDLIVHLPGGRRIAVDAKAPLQPFLDATEAATEAERRQRLEHYGRVVRAHMNQLAGRAYWEQLHPSPEMVVLFLPGESFFSAALEQDRLLIEDGMRKRIVIATPTTLIALLHAVAYGWRQEQVEESAQKVSDLGRQLYERIRTFAGHFGEVGVGLKRSVDSFNRAAGSLESRVLAGARKFRELGAAAGDEIQEMESIDEVPRGLRAPELCGEPPASEPASGPESDPAGEQEKRP